MFLRFPILEDHEVKKKFKLQNVKITSISQQIKYEFELLDVVMIKEKICSAPACINKYITENIKTR